MGRKIREYPSREFYREMFNEYFSAHTDMLIGIVLQKTGIPDAKTLHYEEFHGRFIGDCGLVYIVPINKEHAREWRLDDGISAQMCVSNPKYNTQSTTIMEIMVEQMLKDLGLDDKFLVSSRLL